MGGRALASLRPRGLLQISYWKFQNQCVRALAAYCLLPTAYCLLPTGPSGQHAPRGMGEPWGQVRG
jgi:hypothetical protein